ncbi:hypothetical protein HYH03_012101 [Edaphochlamys debaryana]|uniref:Protein kinase domain-containing protein n=1 Tax=Edaphochlamys debaryana TaxID=47281 RepID=A0A835XTL7_9CHLO|nr:hypothetical protein HYH03_012101 [Edaphochlamys debaryana]|eukprot:KAG2489465.1 hypothetical protein HYH03_012101 [Edaphochlamys debaryana]
MSGSGETQHRDACRPPTDWRDIPLLQQYYLTKQIGKGGFSEVWAAKTKESTEPGSKAPEVVAVKVVQLTCADLEPEEIATLLAEAKFLRNLDCPYLLKCREVVATKDWLVLVLEYLTGGEMFQHIHKIKKYDEMEAARLFAQLENIMFTMPVEKAEAEGKPLRIKIIDLGMSAQYDAKKPLIGCVGTPGFVSPEVWHDKPHTFALDVYALGVVLFVMLTGRKHFNNAEIKNMTYLNRSIKDAPGLQDERFLSLSEPAKQLLMAMLADSPEERPTCMEVLHHPFITAVDSDQEAHRQIGEGVRKRMRELAQLGRVRGLQYALRAPKPGSGDHRALMQELEARRRRLREAGNFDTSAAHMVKAAGRGPRPAGPAAAATAPLSVENVLLEAPEGESRHSSAKAREPFAGAPHVPGNANVDEGDERLSAALVAATAKRLAAAPPGRPGAGDSLYGDSTYDAASRQPEGAAAPNPLHAKAPQPRASRRPLPSFDGLLAASRRFGRPGSDAIVAAAARGRTISDAGDFASGVGVTRRINSATDLALLAAAAGQTAAPGRSRVDLVNALAPALTHCSSMPVVGAGGLAALGLGGIAAGGAAADAAGTGDQVVEGGSPMAMAALVEQALMLRCMSANPATLELMRHQGTIDRLLAAALAGELEGLEGLLPQPAPPSSAAAPAKKPEPGQRQVQQGQGQGNAGSAKALKAWPSGGAAALAPAAGAVGATAK